MKFCFYCSISELYRIYPTTERFKSQHSTVDRIYDLLMVLVISGLDNYELYRTFGVVPLPNHVFYVLSNSAFHTFYLYFDPSLTSTPEPLHYVFSKNTSSEGDCWGVSQRDPVRPIPMSQVPGSGWSFFFTTGRTRQSHGESMQC